MVRSDRKPVINGFQLKCQWLGERQAVGGCHLNPTPSTCSSCREPHFIEKI